MADTSKTASRAADRSDVSAVDTVYQALFDAITNGVRAPGSRLVETEIASAYGVSRTPVRSALSRLKSENLAAHSSSKGLIVADLSREEVDDIYAMRAALEGFAARLAAFVALPRDVQQLELMHEHIATLTEKGELERVPRLNFQFHREIHRIAKNATLQRFVQQIYAMLRRYRGSTITQPGRAEEALAEHAALITAIRDRDPESAERIARLHIENAQRVRLALLHRLDD